MPEAGTHMICLDRGVALLPGGDRLRAAVAAEPAYAYLGSSGPDLFYWTYGAWYYKLASKIIELIEFFDEAVAPIREELKPIEDAVNEMEETLAETVPGLYETLQRLKAAAETASAAVKGALLLGVLEVYNLFCLIKPYIQDDKPESTWWWGDLMHYRKTGELAMNLLAGALERNDDRFLAYAAGYISHVAADTTGHPFVNKLVGGPYRTQFIRHHIIENHIETWVWAKYNSGADISTSRLDQKIDLGYDLPGGFVDFVTGVIKNTYAGCAVPDHNPDMQEAYNIYKLLLKRQTSGSFTIPEPKRPSLNFPPPPEPPDISNPFSGGGGGGWDFSWDAFVDFLKNIFDAAGELLDYLVDLAEFALKVLDSLATYPLRWLLYLIQLLLWQLFQTVRDGLVAAGVAFPAPGEEREDFIHITKPDDPLYPHRLVTGICGWFPDDSPLDYPSTPQDREGGIATTHVPPPATYLAAPYKNAYPDHFIEGAGEPTPPAWWGSAAHLFRRFLVTGDIPNFNLDGDPAYGSLCWRVSSGKLSDGIGYTRIYVAC